MATRAERNEIGRCRLVNILQKHTVALGRTLEQKIADAGPYDQRIDPHILTGARRELINEGRIIRLTKRNTPWFHLDDAPPNTLTKRLQEQEPIHQAIRRQKFTKRVGQALEIAAYRALSSQETLESFGRKGVGTALVEAIEREAHRLGIDSIFTSASSAAGIMVRLGWQAFGAAESLRGATTVYRKQILDQGP